jgi:hypothetical protein
MAAAVLVLCVVGGAIVLRSSDDTTVGTVGSPRDAKAAPTSDDGKLFEAARLAAVAAHEMQVETELAVYFAASGNDPVARQEWEDQAPNSDKAIAALRDQLDRIDVDALDDHTRPAVDLIARTADSPRTARSIVGGGVTDWPAAFEVYGNISGSFVDASSRLSNSVSSPELNDSAWSWGIAVQIEADVARQQALLTGVFTTGWFQGPEDTEGSSYSAVLEAFDDEQSHKRVLEDFGEPEVVELLRDAMSGNEVAAADDLRQVAIDSEDSPAPPGDVAQWRDYSGRKLDRLRDAETTLADSVLDRARKLPGDGGDGKGSTADDEWAPAELLAGVLVLLAAVVLAFLLGRRTVSPRPT